MVQLRLGQPRCVPANDDVRLREHAAASVACAECPCHVAEAYCVGCDQWLCRDCFAEHNEGAPCHVPDEPVPAGCGA
ncbi:MAG: hypothetical protein A2Y74_05660 [Actinobacteria bacterium RBG_13_63_9]|nr:MAG: hypothetical protein A2Y74_05660 [Actinobacteria bacterium RBG_13_63_9]